MKSIGAVLLAALSIAGCQARPADEVVLTFWAMGREGEVVQELMPDFERENPGIKVKVQQMPWSAAHEKMLTAFVGNSTPDLSQLGNTWIAEFSALGAIEPLDPRLAEASDVRAEDFFAGIWDTNVLEGRVYGVPWYVDTRVLFYRTDILKKAGYESMPGDWKEWVRAMQAVVELMGEDHYAILLPINEYTQPVIFGLQGGSSLLTSDATRGEFSGPEFTRAFRFYLSLFESGYAPPVSNNEVANLYQEFARGYFSMYITGPWNLGEFQRRLPEELQQHWSTAPLPGPKGPGSGLSLAGGSSLVMYRRSAHKEEAWKLIQFLSRTDTQLQFYRLTGNLPGRTQAWEDSSLRSDYRIRAFGEQLHRVRATPKLPEWEQIATRLQERTESAIRGAAHPESALRRLDDDVDRILEKRRWLLQRKQNGTAVESASRS